MGKKRKRKSRVGHYLYALVTFVLALAIVVVAILLLTHIQKIEISGNVYSEQEEILEWTKEELDVPNSLYALLKFNLGSYKKPEYLEKVKVGISAPWILKVKVTEKKIIGCTLSGGSYVGFDNEGLVILKSPEVIEGVPVIEGVDSSGTVNQYEKISVTDEKVFSYIVDVMQEVKKNELEPDRVVWENEGMSLYFEGVCVKLGKNNFAEKIIQIPPILEKLTGEKGTLHLEHYDEMSNSISFEREETAME